MEGGYSDGDDGLALKVSQGHYHSVNDDIGEQVKLVGEGEKKISLFRLFCVCMWTMGVTFGFNAEFVLGTPMFVSLG